MVVRRFCILLSLIATLFTASSEGATTFGPEWELANDDLVITHKVTNVGKLSDLLNEIERLCAVDQECHVLRGGQVEFANGHAYWIHVGTDQDTIEITGKGSTVAEYKKLRDTIQKYVFEAGESVRLFPNSETYGAGHIHIGVESSGMAKDPTLFRNVLVDFFNHHEFAEGVLYRDHINAMPVSFLSDDFKEKLHAAVDEFDASERTAKDINQLVTRISDAYESEKPGVLKARKYHAVNVEHVKTKGTLEIRSLRMQRDADEFIAMIELFDQRIEFLKKLGTNTLKLEALDPIRGKVKQLERYKAYVEDCGLDWAVYRKYLGSDYQSALRHLDRKIARASCSQIEILQSVTTEP